MGKIDLEPLRGLFEQVYATELAAMGRAAEAERMGGAIAFITPARARALNGGLYLNMVGRFPALINDLLRKRGVVVDHDGGDEDDGPGRRATVAWCSASLLGYRRAREWMILKDAGAPR